MKHIIYIFLIAAASTMALSGCIEDGFTSSPSDQPVFSTDTLNMGEIFTEEGSTTHRFTVYNRHSKGLNISRVSLSGENAGLFRLNVDGMSGTSFENVEIRANDSIFVYVDVKLPPNGKNEPVDVSAQLDFLTNGVTQSVTVTATGRDVKRLRGCIIDRDTHFTAEKPYQIYDSLVVSKGVTLTLDPGVMMHFHDKAGLIVRGTLVSNGTPEAPVNMAGDRTGNVITDVTFDLMSRQWDGVSFTPTSRNNVLRHTCIRNTKYGVTVVGEAGQNERPSLTIVNSRLRNSGDYVLWAEDADIYASGSEFAEAAFGVVYLQGGEHRFEQCTFANYYLFSAIGGPALQFAHLNADDDAQFGLESAEPYTAAEFANCIVYGLGGDLSHGDLINTQVYLRNCLLKSAGTDDEHFLNCLWDSDPLYYTVRDDYVFDYRLRADSPAIGAADKQLNTQLTSDVDWYGVARNGDLGAYVYVKSEE